MKKTIHIEGMMCGHWGGHREEGSGGPGRCAERRGQPREGTAIVALTADVADADLKAAVEAKDYTVTGIDA